VSRDNNEVDVHTRTDWQPILVYDENADLEFLQSFVLEDMRRLAQDASVRSLLMGAENSIRVEKLESRNDPHYDQKLANLLQELSKRL
jgi:hypothetical protein